MINKSLFSSDKQDWATPWDVFNKWNNIYGPFTLDVCATANNTKCKNFYSPEHNALLQDWHGRCWMNPPYGRGIKAWVQKAADEVYITGNAVSVTMLLPARTDTIWWHEIILPNVSRDNIRFIKGRLKFIGAKASAPFPSVVVHFEDVG